MAFSEQQKQEILDIVNKDLEKQFLKYQIVQQMPDVPVNNTLYFLQVSTQPRLFKLFHTDKDGDLAELFN